MLGIISDAVAGLTGYRSDFSGDLDDRWYMPRFGGLPPEGLAFSPETIFRCGVVLAAIRFRADIFSQSQPSVVKRVGNTRRELPDHYAHKVLRKPCLWMTGVRWRHLQMIRMQLGNSYNLIVSGPGTVVAELRPVDRDRMHVKAQRADGSLVYDYRPPGSAVPWEEVGQERVLHFRGFSIDGREGMDMCNLLHNAVEIALLAERHTATTLKKGARIAGLLIPEGDVGGKDKRQELADSVNSVFSAQENTGQMGVLPWGVKYQALAMDNQKAQLTELRDFQVGDVLRFLGVPGVVVNWGEKTATFASAEAFFEEARRCVLPWVVNIEAEEHDALLPDEDELSIKHNLDAVLRADTEKRYAALQKAAGRPWMKGNEARSIEDMDPVTDDPSMDRVAPPPNQSGTDDLGGDGKESAPPPRRRRAPGPPPPDEDEDAQASRVAADQADRFRRSAFTAWLETGGRVVRRELSEVQAALSRPRFQKDPDAWRAWVVRFYRLHTEHVAQAMHISTEHARDFADRREDELLAGDAAEVLAQWGTEYAETAADLAHIALYGDSQ